MSFKRLLLGRKGEKQAEKYLKRKGFKLLHRNYKMKAGEIDLIMEDGQELVNAGDLGYWPTGSAFCVFFGAMPITSPASDSGAVPLEPRG